jgi:hypothetical protein
MYHFCILGFQMVKEPLSRPLEHTRLDIGFGSDSAPQSYDPTLHDKLFRLLIIKTWKPF